MKNVRTLAIRLDTGGVVPETAMVMAAGLGKRMRPLTATRPKPLVEVAGKPLLDHALDRLRGAGIRRAVINVHYLADALEAPGPALALVGALHLAGPDALQHALERRGVVLQRLGAASGPG
jgi:MurNAc alpha-1-phosphate uridylyltransferase